MIINYIKVSLRNLLKHKQSNFLNITALAFGLACCTACYLHIRYELEYDQYNENFQDIYRVVAGNPNESEYWTKIAAPMPAVFKDQVPEVRDYTRFSEASYNPKVLVQVGAESFLEPYFMMADPSFFSVFTMATLSGNPAKALEDLNSIVITESIAKKLFGDTNPIGKILTLKEKGSWDFQVGAVIADLPPQSHFKFDYLISFENLERLLGEGKANLWALSTTTAICSSTKMQTKQLPNRKFSKPSSPFRIQGRLLLNKYFYNP